MARTGDQRRIRQGLWAEEHRFFAPTAPGLEALCARELESLDVNGITRTAGGVAFGARLDAAYRANLWLRTADRVLVRLRDFRVHRWDSLVRQAARVSWEAWLPAGGPLAVEVSLKRSNLKHRGRIAEVVREAIGARLAEHGLAPPSSARRGDPLAHRLLVRGQGVRALISLDVTGEHLHRRGYRRAAGAAPLRENLAAALLLHCGYHGGLPLLDGMCGAGTLAIEAALIARRLAPGRHREFALLRAPAHHQRTWIRQRREADARALPEAPAPILAMDQRAAALRATADNAERAGVDRDIGIAREDFLRAEPPELDEPGLLVLNPPYGRRLGDPRQARRLLAAIGNRLQEAYPGWRCGAVVPRAAWVKLLGLRQESRLVVPHGGQRVILVCGEVPG